MASLPLLFFAKISAVLTVFYAGLNLHQLTCSYHYLLAKTEEFREAVTGEGGLTRLARLNLFFYVIIPGAYMALLKISAVHAMALAALGIKFMLTAFLEIRTEKDIILGKGYTPGQHLLGRADNFLNIAAAGTVIYLILISPK